MRGILTCNAQQDRAVLCHLMYLVVLEDSHVSMTLTRAEKVNDYMSTLKKLYFSKWSEFLIRDIKTFLFLVQTSPIWVLKNSD